MGDAQPVMVTVLGCPQPLNGSYEKTASNVNGRPGYQQKSRQDNYHRHQLASMGREPRSSRGGTCLVFGSDKKWWLAANASGKPDGYAYCASQAQTPAEIGDVPWTMLPQKTKADNMRVLPCSGKSLTS